MRGEGPETACSESGAPSLQLRLRPGASPAKPTRPLPHASAHRDPNRCQLGWGAGGRSGPITGIHCDTRVLGHLSLGPWVLMQVLTTWVSALCPQNMLEQLLIQQPKDPITFMIEHLQRDNDYGEHWSGPPPPSPAVSLPSPSWEPLGTTLSSPCLKGGQNRAGKGFANLGRWLIENALISFGAQLIQILLPSD